MPPKREGLTYPFALRGKYCPRFIDFEPAKHNNSTKSMIFKNLFS